MLKKVLPSSLKRKVRSILTKFTCPFCGGAYNELLPIGLDHAVLREKQVIGAGRRNAGCPNCGSTDRERAVYDHLSHGLKIFGSKHASILHIAPEKHISKVLLAHGFDEYVCGDLFTDGYSYPAHVQNMNVLDLPFGAGHFDLVICNHVLEHVPDDRRAMSEIYRVLKKEGQAILQVPISKNSAHTIEDPSITDPNERERLFGQFDHIRIYGQDYVQRLEACGFKVQRTNMSGRFKKHGLNKEEDLFICVK